ncbi:MAG: tetratricopeptide repeat protein [Caldilineaceae bacterium]
MAKKSRFIGQRFQNASSFLDHLKLVLEFHKEPAVLAAFSPLATPYFLSGAVNQSATDEPLDWGLVLCAEIARTADLLWDGAPAQSTDELMALVEAEPQAATRDNRYAFLVLELNYFQRIVRPRPRNQAAIYSDILHIARATHDRHLREAVERLGHLFLQRLRPTVRLETPALRTALIGRDKARYVLHHALGQGQSLALVGVGGVGKTTLGTWLAQQWQEAGAFWFTVRPHFNDQLPSLLFALGYFLHRQGASGLWLQLVADGGKVVDANLALGLALADMEALPRPPLLCFDEVDLLRAADPERANLHHAQMLEFINGLRHHAPLLLIGQRAVLETDATLTLDRLTHAEIEEWLQHADIAFSSQDLAQLEQYTNGNPRLLTLCLALHRTLEQTDLAETLVRLPHTPALGPIWDRMRQRLPPAQRQLLYALSVFRNAAPQDAWAKVTPTDASHAADPIQPLIEHHLIHADGAGGVALLPTLRTVLYEDLAVEQQEQLHLQAAYICATRGEITEAAYHLWQGGQPGQAVQLWYPQRRAEIARGFAVSALEIFAHISTNRLKPAQQRQLALLRAELYDFVGEPEKMVDNLAGITWPNDAVESIDAMHLWGIGLQNQGETSAAQQKLHSGIDIITYLFNKYTQLHVRRGTIYMHEREARDAWREANLARYHAEHLQGTIQDQVGNYSAALAHYAQALALAQDLDDVQAVARAQYYLGIVASRQQDFAAAFAYFDAAIENYARIGNRTQEMYVRSNLAACHLLAQQYTASIEQAKQALAFYERAHSPYWIALNACNLAEAHVELGKLGDAESYALKTIEQEEADTFAYGLWILGRVRRGQANFAEATQLLAQAIQISQENEDRWQVAYCRRTLGEVYADQHDGAAAVAELQAALELFQAMQLAAEVEKTAALLKGLI